MGASCFCGTSGRSTRQERHIGQRKPGAVPKWWKHRLARRSSPAQNLPIFYRVFSQAQFLGHASRSIQHRLKVSSFRVAWAMCVSVKYWEFNPPEMKNFPWWRVSVSTYFVDHTPPHGRDTFSFLIFCKFHKQTYLGRCLNTHTTCRDSSSGVSPEIAATVHEDSCSKSRCAGTVIPP